MPFPLPYRLLASGNLYADVLGRLFVTTDDHGKMLAVGVYRWLKRGRVQVLVSTVGDPMPTMTLRARWTGPLPRVGDYLMSQVKPRAAYRIVREPASDVAALMRADGVVHLRLVVEKVDLPLPSGATVLPWKWDQRGKNKGSRT